MGRDKAKQNNVAPNAIDRAVLRGRKAALVEGGGAIVFLHRLGLQRTLDMPLNAVGPRDPQLGLAII